MFVIVSFMIVIGFICSIFTIPLKTNATQRTPLVGQVNKTEWYQDDIGWIANASFLTEGLEEFYKKTGVQPFVLMVPYNEAYWNGEEINVDAADGYLNEFYENKFTDEAHFIFAYFEWKEDDKSEMYGEFRYLSGYLVDTIMDTEAQKIFMNNLDMSYHDTSLSIEEMISKTFDKTAERIMMDQSKKWELVKFTAKGVCFIAALILLIVLVVKLMKRKREKEEYNRSILNAPLETFGANNDTSDIEKKYQ